jgi:hypothetical protein
VEHNTKTQLIYYVEYVSLNILQNVLVIDVLNVKKGYVPNVKNIIACLKALEHMTLFQLKIIRNYQIIFQKLFITAKTMIWNTRFIAQYMTQFAVQFVYPQIIKIVST